MRSTPQSNKEKDSATKSVVLDRPLPLTRRRRVFFLVDSLNVGGTETQAVELALRMDKARYEVTLGCMQKEGPLLQKLSGSGIEVIEFRPRGGFDTPSGLYQLLRMSQFLRKRKFDVVHTHDLWSNPMGIVAAKLAGTPATVSSQRDLSHDAWYRSRRSRIHRRIQKMSSAVLTNAKSIRDGLVDEGFDPEQVRVIYNGVDLERFRTARRDRERLFPGLRGCKLVVLVGNMHSEVKGQRLVIAAAPQILDRFPNTRFILAGDGELRPKFEKEVCEVGVESSFMFLGRRSDVPEILAACDIAILPSFAEGMPNAVLEYLAAGLPTVATAVGGNGEVVEDGISGILIPPKDPEALATAVCRLLENENLSAQIARNGHARVRQKFSFENLIEEVDKLYTDLLRRRSVSA